MNSVRSLFLALCFAMLGGGLIRLIAPQGGWEKTVRSITGLFIVGCVLIPFTRWYHIAQNDGLSELSVSSPAASSSSCDDVQAVLQTMVLSQTQEDIARQIRELLESNQYAAEEVRVSLLWREGECIGAEIIVTLSDQNIAQKEAIFSLLSEAYPEPFVIAVRQEDVA